MGRAKRITTEFELHNNVQRTKCFRCRLTISFPAKVTQYAKDLCLFFFRELKSLLRSRCYRCLEMTTNKRQSGASGARKNIVNPRRIMPLQTLSPYANPGDFFPHLQKDSVNMENRANKAQSLRMQLHHNHIHVKWGSGERRPGHSLFQPLLCVFVGVFSPSFSIASNHFLN